MTLSYNDYQQITRETSGSDELAVLALGLVGESIEVKRAWDRLKRFDARSPLVKSATELTAELGDVLWYAARIYDVCGADFRAWQSKRMLSERWFQMLTPGDAAVDDLLVLSAEVSEHVKKVVGHGHELDANRMLNATADVVRVISCLACAIHGPAGLGIVFDYNVEKLHKRYPNGFEVERSVNRSPSV